jgi:hypothetical protein
MVLLRFIIPCRCSSSSPAFPSSPPSCLCWPRMEEYDEAKGHVEGTSEGHGEDAQRPDAQNRAERSGDSSCGEDANSPAKQNAGQGRIDELGSTPAAPAANDDAGHTLTRTDDDQDGDAKRSNRCQPLETPRTRYKNFLAENKRKRLEMGSRQPVNLNHCDSVGNRDTAETTSDGEEKIRRDGTAMTCKEHPEPGPLSLIPILLRLDAQFGDVSDFICHSEPRVCLKVPEFLSSESTSKTLITCRPFSLHPIIFLVFTPS